MDTSKAEKWVAKKVESLAVYSVGKMVGARVWKKVAWTVGALVALLVALSAAK